MIVRENIGQNTMGRSAELPRAAELLHKRSKMQMQVGLSRPFLKKNIVAASLTVPCLRSLQSSEALIFQLKATAG